MNSNCYYIKEFNKPCDDKQVRKYKIKVLEPAKGTGICQYNLVDIKDGDIIEEPCNDEECSTDDYNNNSQTDFKNAINCLLNSFNTTFAKDFSGGPGDCSSDKLIKQSFKLVIGPDADLSDCKVSVDQRIDMSSEKVCANINETLSKFEGEEKYKFITNIVNKVIDNQPESIRNKTEFIKRFKKLLIDSLMVTQGQVNAKCSQSISVSQDQNIYLLGRIKCSGSNFKFSQEAVVSSYISCITAPVLDSLKNDQLLKKYYTASPNSDCIYDLQIVEPCDGKQRKVKVNMISPKKGTGKCEYNGQQITANQTLTQKCKNDNCEVSEWDDWSPCLVDEVQYRTRRIILQGKDCPSLFQERECKYEPIRSRPNSRPETPLRQIINKNTIPFYEVFVNGPSSLDPKNKMIFYAFFIFFIFIFIYAIFF